MPDTTHRAREDRLKRNLDYLRRRFEGADAMPAPGGSVHECQGNAAVVCWDVSHNPAGRAYVLAKLLASQWRAEIVGPIWPRFGKTLWEPLRGSGISWRGLHVTNLSELIVQAGALSLTRHYDLVVVTKPRLPGLLLGLFLAEQSRSPLIFDFDEDEKAFLQHHTEDPGEASAKLIAEPFGTSGTLLAAQYWTTADAVTVASPLLRRAFGGHLVRHSRDEQMPLTDRAAARRNLGYSGDDVVLSFIGTVRAHKGLDQVVTAMEAIDDARLKLIVVGPIDDATLRARLARLPERVRIIPSCDISEVGTYLAAADLMPLLQNPNALITQSQFPAKVTDALQHGVPIVASTTPPLAESALSDVVDWIAPDGLPAYLSARLNGFKPPEGRRAKLRMLFEDEFSDRINRVRLESAVQAAVRLANPYSHARSEVLRSLLSAVRRARQDAQRRMFSPPNVLRQRPRYDIAFFWKQNDSGLFGRRADLVTSHLHRTGLVRRIVHFDHSLHGSAFAQMGRDFVARAPNISAIQFHNQALRVLRLLDEPDLLRRVLLTEAPNIAPGFGGESYHQEAKIPEQVAAVLRDANCDPARTIAWVCPIVWNFAAIASHVPFYRVVVDLIDDQRTWAKSTEDLNRVQAAYEQTLQRADLVLTNAEGNRARFTELHPNIHVVPNGAELDLLQNNRPLPDFMRDRNPPIIGYCGNLRDRIDWPLIEALASRHLQWDFVLIGPQGEQGVPQAIQQQQNVILPGPLPYDTARHCMAAFDCAIVPHVSDAMTGAMNPLKVYNYLGAGVPVVTTPVSNLEALGGLISVADGVEAFSEAIAAALAAPKQAALSAETRELIGWENRMARITTLLESICKTFSPGM